MDTCGGMCVRLLQPPLGTDRPRVMKVRLTADMLRMRLDQRDVEALAESGRVAFVLSLGSDQSLRCTLNVQDTSRAVTATYTGDELRVTLPADRAHSWMTTDAVSIEEQIEVDGSTTQILVEKDLGCRHGDDVPQASTFDHLRE